MYIINICIIIIIAFNLLFIIIIIEKKYLGTKLEYNWRKRNRKPSLKKIQEEMEYRKANNMKLDGKFTRLYYLHLEYDCE